MSLNIKNERVHDLVREASRRTGFSQTRVVEVALERMLHDLAGNRASEREAELRSILDDFDTRLTADQRTQLTTDDLYDDLGLPA